MRRRLLAALGMVLLALSSTVAGARDESFLRQASDTLFMPVVSALAPARGVSQDVLMQDQAGFLWAGGASGLARWDGYRFRAFGIDQATQDGLSDPWVRAMRTDRKGRLWVGTQTGLLAHYDSLSERFVKTPLTDGQAGPGTITAIQPDIHDGIWVAAGSTLFRLDGNDHVAKVIRHDARIAGSLPDAAVTDMLLDRRSEMWIGGPAGLLHTVGAGVAGGFVPFPLPLPAGKVANITRLFEDSLGQLWVGTRQHGAFVIGAGRTSAIPVPDSRIGGTAQMAAEITTFAEIRPRLLWVGTRGHGIVEVEQGPAGAMQSRRIMRETATPDSLESNLIRALYRDRAGIVWVGTPAGLSESNWANPGLHTIFGIRGASENASVGDVTALLGRPDGELWVGLTDGIDILNQAGRHRTFLPMMNEVIYALADGQFGTVVIGSRNGLYVADVQGQHVAPASVAGAGPPGGVRLIAAIGEDFWLAGIDGGLWRLRQTAFGSFSVAGDVAISRLTDPNVHLIAQMPGGLLVIGTENGFNLLDPHSGAIERVFPDPADPHGLGGNMVVSSAVDRKGRLWLGTSTAGIAIQTGRDAAGRPRFHHIGTAEGLPNLDINKMFTDEGGRIWASTDTGIVVIDPDDFTVRAFGPGDGVMNAPFWTQAGSTLAEGTLVFGGLDGMTFVQPSAISSRPHPPPIVVTGMTVGGKTAWPSSGDDIGAADDANWIIVPVGANSLTVEFVMLDFASARHNVYRYRLDGFDTDWVVTDGAHRVAAYTNLSPGDYVLNLSGSDSDGAWSPRSVRMHVRVLPAWYQTIWAHMGEMGIAVSLIWAMVQGRTVLLRARQRTLERLVVQRTAELSASREALHHLAYFDPLTALPNRRAFNEHFAALLKRVAEKRTAFALVTIDLDGFKSINDTLGHDAGDEILIVAGGRMREAVRKDDFVARLGGDEFAVLVESVPDRSVVDAICRRIVTGMSEPVSINGEFATIGASAGVAIYPQNGTLQVDIYKRADLALYAAKRAGRGVWRWFHEDLAPTG